ncbi:hypothetical protein [Halorussus salinus]|uniref:hypothetical protein n=1 Tax=Halorussus salinus TaxID=1364935 RepID=UPI00138F2EF5|nr:hypothetical protein [Halorussus salinus]
MATDGDSTRQPSDDEMLPDEREVVTERIESLNDDSNDLSVEEVADELDIDLK